MKISLFLSKFILCWIYFLFGLLFAFFMREIMNHYFSTYDQNLKNDKNKLLWSILVRINLLIVFYIFISMFVNNYINPILSNKYNIHIDNDSCNYLIIFSSLIGDKTLGDNIWYYLHDSLMGQEKII